MVTIALLRDELVVSRKFSIINLLKWNSPWFLMWTHDIQANWTDHHLVRNLYIKHNLESTDWVAIDGISNERKTCLINPYPSPKVSSGLKESLLRSFSDSLLKSYGSSYEIGFGSISFSISRAPFLSLLSNSSRASSALPRDRNWK